jgi:hypothetical protein
MIALYVCVCVFFQLTQIFGDILKVFGQSNKEMDSTLLEVG